jgi:hypothetical protein
LRELKPLGKLRYRLCPRTSEQEFLCGDDAGPKAGAAVVAAAAAAAVAVGLLRRRGRQLHLLHRELGAEDIAAVERACDIGESIRLARKIDGQAVMIRKIIVELGNRARHPSLLAAYVGLPLQQRYAADIRSLRSDAAWGRGRQAKWVRAEEVCHASAPAHVLLGT